MHSKDYIELAEKYGAHNYHPLPIVISRAERVWVWNPEGRRFLDMLSSYSALNQGHRHPEILRALREQADRVTLTSRAFHNDQLGPLMEELCQLSGLDQFLPMNTGAEAVETAIKAARKWGYKVKGVADGRAEILVCSDNFHGRTTTIVGFSTEPQYRDGFGPFTPGFRVVPFGDSEELAKAMTPNTVGFLVEPIQGESGIRIPAAGYLKRCREICSAQRVLLIADEIQTGFGRTGKLFAVEHERVQPDILILGKALGGGVLPISGILGRSEVMDLFRPGDHGSTFGGNPLACAVARAAVRVIVEEKLPERSAELGDYFKQQLHAIASPHVREVRGSGLFIGVEIKKDSGPARPFCERLMEEGILAKETHDQVIRFAPPLVIERQEIDWALERIARVLL
ncbi:MAG TPA: ornithine--oxo-acid transaminase [Acidobacteriota bacterium]|jgi:ornithine--oxo-acid transaminase